MGTHYDGRPEERLALDSYIKLTRAADAVHDRVNRHLAEVNLTTSQFGVLEALYHLGPLCQKELGEKILKSSGNITFVIDNLVKGGLVERCRSGDDRRVVNVHLTEAGRRLIGDIFPRHVATVTEEFATLSPEEQAALGWLCKKLGLRGV